ncbi:hypothetical protein HYDPIDRAFT_118920 [Hydnomerulius pinastri MD-312]|uniref:Uncharacterized protein n=1 Tax=Hydnomerulius pinastri MD-312 TaxID=994086 RepID=A0A0C9VX74_9AGAM|nr:hypothetical protein HYDPIDRAFT_120177 [Hydnomerulius pinastri MD-312]KIJ58988.1 hypothetical protein HYDPIDRAFT_118920 [Hydnomerulius pinastri MD-312]
MKREQKRERKDRYPEPRRITHGDIKRAGPSAVHYECISRQRQKSALQWGRALLDGNVDAEATVMGNLEEEGEIIHKSGEKLWIYYRN